MCNCNKGSNPPTMPSQQRGNSMINDINSDDQFVSVVYTHGNRGQHQVTGAATKRSYGYRSGGERFLVHVDDIKAQPQLFKPVSSEKIAARHAQSAPTPPPPPVAIEAVAEDDIPTVPLVVVPKEVEERVIKLDLQSIPGVTPSIERSMKAAGYDTAKSILEATTDDLQKLKWVGAQKARLIKGYIEDKHGAPSD